MSGFDYSVDSHPPVVDVHQVAFLENPVILALTRSRIPSMRYQSDGPLVGRANRSLRYVLLLIADNLLHCDSYFHSLDAGWRAWAVDRRLWGLMGSGVRLGS